MTEYKPVFVDKKTHKKLKKISAETEKTMKKILTDFINERYKRVVKKSHIK